MEQGNDHHPEDADPDCERDGNISSNDCETTNPGVPIRELLIKAKKAASSLWTVLHAQSCTNRNISLASSAIECDYPGCETTKRLLGHIKSCPAAFDILPCPTNVQGCQTVRKLLHHYKTCRHSTYTNSISTHAFTRANRPSPTSTSTNSHISKRKQHQCLVCSLVARHARNALVMEGRGRSNSYISMFSPKNSSKATMVHVPTNLLVHEADRSSSTSIHPTYESNNISGGSGTMCEFISQQDKQPNIMPNPPREPQEQDSITAKMVRSESMKLMPPPPPRPSSFNHQQQYTATSINSLSSLSSSSLSTTMEFIPCTPPTYRQLLHPAMVSAAACVSIPRLTCPKVTLPHRSIQSNNVGYTSVAPSNHTSNVNNERPMYRRPRSQSIDDQLYNQFRKMGGSSSIVVTSRSTSDLSQHDAPAISGGTQSTLYGINNGTDNDGDTDSHIFNDGNGLSSSFEEHNTFFF